MTNMDVVQPEKDEVLSATELSDSLLKEENLRLLEALLFAADKPLTPKIMQAYLGDDADLGDLLETLKKRYASKGINLRKIGKSWAFRTAPDLQDRLELKREVTKKLSRAAIETLSIIAYHQPVTRAEIEAIRGVATNKGTLDLLMEAKFVRPGKRRETPGRPLTWVTTDDFLDNFGMESLKELPGIAELKAAGLLDSRSAMPMVDHALSE